MSDAEEFLNEMKAEHPEAFQEERSAACYEKALAALQRDNARLREALFAAPYPRLDGVTVQNQWEFVEFYRAYTLWFGSKPVTAARIALEPRDE